MLFSLAGCSLQNRPDALSSADKRGGETALYQQAIAHLKSNEPDKAERIFRTLTKESPSLTEPWVNLALIELKRNNIDAAEKLLNAALERDPTFPQTLNLLGVIESKKGNARQAEKFYSQAIAQRDEYAIAHYNLALLYDIYLQDRKKAVPHYQRYLELIDYKDENTSRWLEGLKSTLSRERS